MRWWGHRRTRSRVAKRVSDGDLLFSPSGTDRAVERLYAWIIIYEDGSESIASTGTLPLVTARANLARDVLVVAANRALRLTQQAGRRRIGARVELRMYRRV
jgi:hypothetical protein